MWLGFLIDHMFFRKRHCHLQMNLGSSECTEPSLMWNQLTTLSYYEAWGVLSHEKWTPTFICCCPNIKIFGPPDNLLKYLDLFEFEISYPSLNLHSTQCVMGDNLFHVTYLILQLYIHIIMTTKLIPIHVSSQYTHVFFNI